MVKHILLFYLFAIFSFSFIDAQTISDISTEDADYPIIKQVINSGYLSLYADRSFKPSTALTRRDVVQIIHMLEQKLNTKTVSLKQQDIIELSQLSKSFKDIYTQTENKLNSVQEENKKLVTEQKILHHQISDLHLSVNRLNKERKLTYSLLAAAGILGILF